MKTLLFILLVALIFGCKSNNKPHAETDQEKPKQEKSNQEKVLELIKEDMFKTLPDFNSYEPIETRVDSAFNSVYTDSTILAIYEVLTQNYNTGLGYLEKAKKAMGKMKTAANDAEFNAAQAEIDKYNLKTDLSTKIMGEKAKEIREKSKEIKNSFYGWKATHKFRSKTKDGNYDITTIIYIFDDQIVRIKYKEDESTKKKNERLTNILADE